VSYPTLSNSEAVRVETAAQLLNVAPSTVRHWIKTGQLPARKIGRFWRMRVEDIRRLDPLQGVDE